MTDRVLVIGSGATEQRLCWSLAQSAQVKQVLFAPGNDGTPSSGKICKSAVLTSNPAIVKQFCKDHNIRLVVISPLALLTAGLVDDLSRSGVKCFGPTSKAALLQSNKSDAKCFMQRYDIPTARWKSFTNPHEACHFITYTDFPALVVKSCAFASGKGPYLTRDKDEACRAVQHLTQNWELGLSPMPIVVEELLEGEEFYCLCVTDGKTLTPIPFGHFEKQSADLNQSQQSASPSRIEVSEKSSRKILNSILRKALDGLRQEGWTYTGLFGAKVMMTAQGPMVLGFRCTLQDLDYQIIGAFLESDLYEMIRAANEDRLCSYIPFWGLGTRLADASLLQKETNSNLSKHPQEANVMTRHSVEETASSSATKVWSVIEFPVTVHRKDEGFPHSAYDNTDRPTPLFQDTPTTAVSASEQSGSRDQTSCRRNICALEVDTALYRDPVLLCTTNSIGDKVKVAQTCSLHKEAAQDLVTMCLNDLLAHGAHILFFMPYLEHSNLPTEVSEAIQQGLAEACRIIGCSLLEREIVDQSTIHHGGCYSLFGCALGVVEREHRLPRVEQMREGDLVIGVQSLGLHCSHLSMLTNILEKHSLQYTSAVPLCDGVTWGDLLLNSAPIFNSSLRQTLRSSHIRACIPVGEGGLVGSILRYIPNSVGLVLDALCWKAPQLYSWLYKEGGLSEQELLGNFSCGLGTVIITQKNMAKQILTHLQQEHEAWIVGGLLQQPAGSSRVWVHHLVEAMKVNTFQLLKMVAVRKSHNISKTAVFISSTEMKLKLLIDTLRLLGGCSKLALIVSSNKNTIGELRRAMAAGVPTRVIEHSLFSCHSDFEHTINQVLEEFSIDIICLAGFGRMLSKQFLNKWKAPFGGQKLQNQDGSSPNPIIIQETFPGGSDVQVSEQMEEAAPRSVAKALHLVTSGVVSLGEDNIISWKASD
ncbi:trifunctional purine biosynthetic protein adenosine-3-like [Gastrophryne carolinensis]